MVRINNFFYEILAIALGNNKHLSSVPSVAEWSALLEESQRQAITGIMLGGIEKLTAEQLPLPRSVLLQWIGLSQMVEGNCLLHRERAAEMTRIFQSAGLRSCVLKGVATALFYPKPLRRQCGDIDLLVSGRRKDVIAYLKNHCIVRAIRWHHADVHFFDDVTTEIHFIPSWLYNPFFNKRLQRWFAIKGLPCVRESEYGFNVPSVEFEAVYSLMHSFHHLMECGIGFRHVIDYYYVVMNLPQTVYEESIRAINSFGLGKFCGAMMWVLKDACGMPSEYLLCEPDEKEGRFLLSEIEASGNFGHQRLDDRGQNTFARHLIMLKHYPRQVIWMVPWKLWHWFWRILV